MIILFILLTCVNPIPCAQDHFSKRARAQQFRRAIKLYAKLLYLGCLQLRHVRYLALCSKLQARSRHTTLSGGAFCRRDRRIRKLHLHKFRATPRQFGLINVINGGALIQRFFAGCKHMPRRAAPSVP